MTKLAQDTAFIIDSLGIGIWKWDVLTGFLEWDKNMYRLYGVRREAFSGAYEAWENSLIPETRARAVEEINAALKGESDFDTTFQVIQKSGKIQEIRARAFVIRDKNGKALKMWGINLDRTREAELEHALQKQDETLRTVVDAIKDYAIFMMDTEGRITSWNEGAKRIKYYDASEIMGRHFSIFYSKEDLQALVPERELEAAKRTGRVEAEGWRIRKDGSRFWANVIITCRRIQTFITVLD